MRQYRRRRRGKFKETRSDTRMLVEIFTSTEASVNKNRLDSALKSTVTDIQIYNGKKLKDFGIELNFVCYTQRVFGREEDCNRY